jgi:crossover junction endodeoxyribonuclease RuvC
MRNFLSTHTFLLEMRTQYTAVRYIEGIFAGNARRHDARIGLAIHSYHAVDSAEKDCLARSTPAVHLEPMRVFGVDCGTEVTGFGVVETAEGMRESGLIARALGAIRLEKSQPLPQRLDQVFRELTAEMERWQPDTVAIEEVFYSVNAKSALKLGQVRGVALLAAARQGIAVAEYAPLKIKSSVVGYGLAQKEQVQFMVARLLGLDTLPQPADAADALAVAICHIHTAQTMTLQEAR